jgi:hypothetical protein
MLRALGYITLGIIIPMVGLVLVFFIWRSHSCVEGVQAASAFFAGQEQMLAVEAGCRQHPSHCGDRELDQFYALGKDAMAAEEVFKASASVCLGR